MLNVTKGQKLSITKNGSYVDNIIIRVNWNGGDEKMDLDLSTIALMDVDGFAFGKGVAEQHVCYFGQPNTPAMKSSGDDKGAKDSDSGEEIEIEFSRLPSNVTHVHAILTLYHAARLGQKFSDLKSATMEVIDKKSGDVIMKTEAKDFDKNSTSLLFAVFRREDKGFSFTAINESFQKEIGDYFTAYGFQTEE